MRNCSACGSPDRLWFEDAECSCGASTQAENPGDPTQHVEGCHSLGHWVSLFPVRLKVEDVDREKRELKSRAHKAQGWKLYQNGLKFYRVKMLCRDCGGKETQAQARRAEYEKLCRVARGQDSTTYAQMLARQDQF